MFEHNCGNADWQYIVIILEMNFFLVKGCIFIQTAVHDKAMISITNMNYVIAYALYHVLRQRDLVVKDRHQITSVCLVLFIFFEYFFNKMYK